MADWGLSRALTGLYGDVGKRENANRELGVLSAMEQMRQFDQQQETQAQAQQQAFYNQVNEFSNQLLGPDRQKFQNKAGLLQKKLKDHLRSYGGSVRKFMDNGGFQMLQNYQHDLMNSEEAGTYLDNKRNMDLIVAAQMNGKGHLINPTDLKNLEAYNETGEGAVTYSGMLNEIEMPDSDHYDWNTDIPAEDILSHEDNYVKIYGNYVTTYPDLGEPTEKDLENFVKQHYKGRGSNWRRKAYMDEQAAKRAAAAAKLNQGPQNKRGDYENQYSGIVRNIFANTGKNLKIEDYQSGYWENTFSNPNMVNTVAQKKYTGIAQDYAMAEKGLFDVNRETIPGGFNLIKNTWLEDWFTEEFQPREARYYYENDEAIIAKAALNLQDNAIDMSSKTIKNWQPNDNTFTASGVRVGDLDDELELDAYNNDYTIDGIINAAFGKAGNGPHKDGTQMVMNVMKGDDVDPEKTASFDEQLSGADLRHDLFIVLRDEDNNVFYQPLNMSDPRTSGKLMAQLDEYDDYSPAVINNEYIDKQEALVDQALAKTMEPINNFYDQIDGNETIMNDLTSELLYFSPTGKYDPMRENLAISFYAATSMLEGGDPVQNMQDILSGGAFTDFIQSASTQFDRNMTRDLQNGDIGDLDFIKNLWSQDEVTDLNEQFYGLWMQNYKTLVNR